MRRQRFGYLELEGKTLKSSTPEHFDQRTNLCL
jgi:hypothetical protein